MFKFQEKLDRSFGNNQERAIEMDLDGLRYNLNCNAADNLVQNIRSMIYSREIQPGFEFPKEAEFCKQLGVSRSTLREALKVLEATGFIKRVKGHGTMVQEVTGIMAAAPLNETMQLASLEDLMDFREMIETELAKYAAIRATDEEIKLLDGYLSAMKDSVGNLANFSRNDANFHIQIALASKNSLMIAIMKNMQSLITRGVFAAFQIDTHDNMLEAIDIHSKILDAIKIHDSNTASELMRKHIQSVSHRISHSKIFEKYNGRTVE